MTKLSEWWARRFHDEYERLAPEFGYETRRDTKEFEPRSPNGKLMIAVIESLGIAQFEDENERLYIELAECWCTDDIDAVREQIQEELKEGE